MPQIDIGEFLSYGWNRFKSNVAFHLLCMVVIAFVGAFSFGLIAGCLVIGYMRALKKQDQGGSAEIGDLFGSFDAFVPSFILLLVMVVACMIPFGSLVISPIYFVALYLVSEGETDGIAALKRAFELCQPVLVMAVVASFVFLLVGNLGLLLCCVGIFATLPISILANYRMTQVIVGASQNQQPATF